MLGIGNEISIFVSACLLGNMASLMYYAIRVFRRIVKHTLFWVSIEDFIFWAGTGFYLFTEMYRTCAGSIRWYFVLGVLAGGGITCWLLQKFVGKFMKKVVDKSKKTR